MSLSTRDLQELLRAIRSARLGNVGRELPAPVAGYAALGVPGICKLLEEAALQAEALDDRASDREVAIWIGFYGISGGLPRSLRDLGSQVSVGAGRAGQLRLAVDRAVAKQLEPLVAQPARLMPLDTFGVQSADDRVATERAIAEVHAETVFGGDERDVRVIESLARELLGEPRRRTPPGEPLTPRDPSAHRRRRRLRAEIAFNSSVRSPELRSGVVDDDWRETLASSLDRIPEDVLSRETAMAHLSTGRPDLDLLRLLVDCAEEGHRTREIYVADLLKVIGLTFGRFESSPDPSTEARALTLSAARFREAEHMGTYVVAQRIEALVGPHDFMTIVALGEAALVLRANHFLALADEFLRRSNLGVRLMERSTEKWGRTLSNVSTSAAVASNSIGRSNARSRIERSHDELSRILAVMDKSPDMPLAEWRTVIMRRQIQLDLAVSIATNEESQVRYRRVSLPRDTARWRSEARLAAQEAADGPWPMSWALQEMRIALVQRDPDAFWEARDLAAECHLRQPHFPNLVVDFNTLIERAIDAGWNDPRPVTIETDEGVELMKLVRPDRFGTV